MSDAPKDPRDPGEESPGDVTSSDAARWQRPTQQRPRSPHSEDRFPMLPEEAPLPTAPLKEPPRRAPSAEIDLGAQARSRERGRNLITIFFLLATCGVLSYFAVLWQNPYSVLNPLAPPTPLPQVVTATYTPTITPTPLPTDTPSETLTPSEIPSVTPTLTFTPIFVQDFSTPQGTPASTEDTTVYQFSLQRNRVLYITNPAARGGCNWSSIAGSVLNYDGSALNGYGVHVVGENVDQTVATGSAPGFGPGGFEVPLGNVARDAQYIAQLIDPQGNPVSPVYTVTTNSDCNFNIAALRFVENLPTS